MTVGLRITILVVLRILVQTGMLASLAKEEPSYKRAAKMMFVLWWAVITAVNSVLYALELGGDRVVDWLSMGYLG